MTSLLARQEQTPLWFLPQISSSIRRSLFYLQVQSILNPQLHLNFSLFLHLRFGWPSPRLLILYLFSAYTYRSLYCLTLPKHSFIHSLIHLVNKPINIRYTLDFAASIRDHPL